MVNIGTPNDRSLKSPVLEKYMYILLFFPDGIRI